MVDHLSINRLAIRFLPLLGKVFWNHKHGVGRSCRMDETYIKVNGTWKYLYRAVDKHGKTVDFLLNNKRDAAAARRFFDKAMQLNEVPDTVTTDKSGANKAALNWLNAERATLTKVRQVRYLNNIVDQDHRAVKRVTRPMLGFKSFRAAQAVLAGIELMHMISKGQFNMAGCDGMSIAKQFYTLAAQVPPK